eukprot:Protomagalhaensia_sp_Gyna_25__2207@NODE_21_length_7814_cov_1312_689003_g14_i0_p3_GENE_NODE_21_length_7814_cov_1312_689003_g14_i0NODE_21_length_7814_cov_1312_689003_g14_i0_p3_ORF_typecomplete_len186_score15_37_NODE_21_length_7814_cov_1312_689003_g14_i027983355
MNSEMITTFSLSSMSLCKTYNGSNFIRGFPKQFRPDDIIVTFDPATTHYAEELTLHLPVSARRRLYDEQHVFRLRHPVGPRAIPQATVRCDYRETVELPGVLTDDQLPLVSCLYTFVIKAVDVQEGQSDSVIDLAKPLSSLNFEDIYTPAQKVDLHHVRIRRLPVPKRPRDLLPSFLPITEDMVP